MIVQRVLAGLLLAGLAPLIAPLTIAVRVSLGSPVLFRQERAGFNGQAFTMIKLRSMTDARDRSGALLSDDERVTRFGRFLRRSRLDELPGLYNIARGDMVFVGPRPLLPQTIAALGEPGRRRGSVRPGLTGWAQVNGNTLLTLDEKVALDLWYVRHAGLRLDAEIAARTLWVMIGGEKLRRSEPARSVRR